MDTKPFFLNVCCLKLGGNSSLIGISYYNYKKENGVILQTIHLLKSKCCISLYSLNKSNGLSVMCAH